MISDPYTLSGEIINVWVDTFEGEGLLKAETPYQHGRSEVFQPGLAIGRLHTRPAGTR